MSVHHQKAIIAAAALLSAAALAVVGVLVVSGHRSQSQPQPVQPQSATGLTSPFTGEPVRHLKPVLTVKIDNVAAARPQTGLADADIVYVLPVEGGLSRLLAVYSSHLPPAVGPIRSAREDDLELLRQFGRPAFAYSGATPHLLPFVHRARVADLYAGLVGGYYRLYSRVAPHNLCAHPVRLLAEAKGASDARGIGFRFGPAPAGGQPTASRAVRYPAASFAFTWSAAAHRWLVSMDGSPARSTENGRLGAATVVIQYTVVRTSRFLEYGHRPPYAVSTGSGTGVVLRDGQAFEVRWSRPDADGGTTFTTVAGKRMTFARGPVWIVLASQGE
jgi:hypothetical protein